VATLHDRDHITEIEANRSIVYCQYRDSLDRTQQTCWHNPTF